MVRISSLLINFGEMSFEGDLTDFRVIWKEVGPLPDLVRYAVQGVVVEFACRVIDGPVTVTSERDSVEGTIVYSGAPG